MGNIPHNIVNLTKHCYAYENFSTFVAYVSYHGIHALWRLPLSGIRTRVTHVKTYWKRFGEAQWKLSEVSNVI